MRHSKALMRAESSAKRARARLAQMRAQKNPNLITIGSVALGGALPALLVEQTAMIPDSIAGIPTEGLIGAGLLVASHQFKGDTKKIGEGLGEGMSAVTAYKLAQNYTA